MRARRIIGVALGLGLLGPTRALAQPPSDDAGAPQTASTRVLVLAPRLTGELPDTAAQVRSIVADNLAEDGVEVLVEGEASCEDAACIAQAVTAAGARFAVGTAVVGDEDEFTVTVTLYDDAGVALAPFEDACSICGFVEVRDMVRLRALDARAELVRRQAEAAPAPEPVPPVSLPVDLPAPRSKLVPTGWALVGAGAAATIGGAVLLGLHHRSAGCLENPRGGECVPVRFTTAPAGGAVLGAGVLVVTAGVVMVVLGRRAERRGAPSRVSLRPGGVALRF